MGSFSAFHWLAVLLFVGAIVFLLVRNRKPELTEAELNAITSARSEKFRALGDRIKKMTVAEICAETGDTERGLHVKLIRRNLMCADFDGKAYNAMVEKAGGSEKYMKSLQKSTADTRSYGVVVPALICPHCQTKGQVRRSSGPNEAVLTTSNTYKGKATTKMHCDACGTDWTV